MTDPLKETIRFRTWSRILHRTEQQVSVRIWDRLWLGMQSRVKSVVWDQILQQILAAHD